jgi:phenylacetate-CoA ligase
MVSRLGIAVNRRLLLDTFRFSTARFPEWVDRINAFRPTVVYGYATVLLAFADYLIQSSARLPSVEVVVSTTEKLEGREAISSAFGAPVYDQYGCREILSVGIEIAPDVMVIADDCVVLNVNQEGEILLTALHSLGFPLINYRVGDYAESVRPSSTSAGSLPFSTMRLKVGRITENFLAADGRVVSSSALSVYISSFGFATSGQQIVQDDHRRFRVSYAADSIDSAAYQKTLCSVLEEYFGSDLSVVFERVESISPEPSGKTLMAKRTFGY